MKTNVTKTTYKGIPMMMYDNEKAHRLIFINHGIYGTKEKIMHLIGPQLVKLGYRVVAVDAYKHGERLEEPYASKNSFLARLRIFSVVKRTSEDILKIYHQKFAEEHEDFDVLGISMGGYISYYLTTQTQHLNTFVALISSPAFSKEKVHELPASFNGEFLQEAQEVKTFVEEIDVSKRPEAMQFKQGIALNGEIDDLIPAEYTETFLQQNPDLPIIFKTYNTGHKITKAMSDEVLTLLKKRV